MALTVNERGSGGNNTAGTSFTGVAPNATIAVGSLGVLIITADNAGSGGNTPVCPSSITDSKGNVWTRRQNPIYDPGAASAGVETACYTSLIGTALLSTDNANFTWAGSVSVTAKRFAFKEIVAGVTGATPTYVTGGAGTGAASGTPTVTTGSIASGDCVIGWGGAESADTWAGDADTTNGTWSTHIHGASGTGTSGMSLTTQHKVVTAAGTQTYNPTLTSADQILGWIQVHETLGIALDLIDSSNAPFAPQLNLQVDLGLIDSSSSPFAPTVNAEQTIALGLIDSSNVPFAPQLNLGVDVGLIDQTGVTFAPQVDLSVALPLLDSSQAPFAPTVTTEVTVGLELIEATGQTFAPTIALQIDLGLIDADAQAFSPVISTEVAITLGLVDVGAQVFAPTVTPGPVSVFPDLIDQTGVLFSPTVSVEGGDSFVDLPLLDQAGQTFAPTVSAEVVIDLGVLDAGADVFAPAVTTEAVLVLVLIDSSGTLFLLTMMDASSSSSGVAGPSGSASPAQGPSGSAGRL